MKINFQDMGNVNIQGIISNIPKKSSTIYTPLIEAIVNAIHAIDDKGNNIDGKITIKIKRKTTQSTINVDTENDDMFKDGSKKDIQSFEIIDNGIGFNADNLQSFDMLYSDHKMKKGGKGFGRCMYIKYFKDVRVESCYQDIDGNYKKLNFDFGRKDTFVENKHEQDSSHTQTGARLFLNNLNSKTGYDKNKETIAKKLMENILIYFITDGYVCPKIVVQDDDGEEIVLNEEIATNKKGIQIIKDQNFILEDNNKENYTFNVKIAKIYYPNNKSSKISLCAHNREVVSCSISEYIPEFAEEFSEEDENGTTHNYIIRAYVQGKYLDDNVNLERNSFSFSERGNMDYADEINNIFPFLEEDIEREVLKIIQEIEELGLEGRIEKKKKDMIDYISQEAPYYSDFIDHMPWDKLPYYTTKKEKDTFLNRMRFDKEEEVKNNMNRVLKESSEFDIEDIELLSQDVTLLQKNELAQYVILRKMTLDLLEKFIGLGIDGKFKKEDILHSLIFPTRKTSENIRYSEHNLWILDERISFEKYITSDISMTNGKRDDRIDIAIFDRNFVFRNSSNNDVSMPITIFEFKRPMRTDFTGKKVEDPIEQIMRYIEKIKEGSVKMQNGRTLLVSDNTPFYGYAIFDFDPSVEKMIKRHNMKPFPDKLGYFMYHDTYNLYLEVLSWDKILKDAKQRNKIFFHKLNINDN